MHDKGGVRFASGSGSFFPCPMSSTVPEAVRALFGERQGLRGAADIDAAFGLAGRRQVVCDEGPVARFDVEREHGACDCRPVGCLRS